MSMIYFAVVGVVLVLGHLAEANPRYVTLSSGKVVVRPDAVLAFLVSAMLTAVSGFRYFVGTDFAAYYNNRVTEWADVWNRLITLKEPGLRLFSFIAHKVYDNGQSLILLCAVFTVGLYCLTIYKYHVMYQISLLLFIFMGDWQGSFNAVRQYLAAAILFAGHRLIKDRKIIKYSILVFVAFLFHTSAIIMIVPYFLLTRKPDITQLVVMAAGTVVLMLSYNVLFRFIGEAKGTTMNTEDEYLSTGVKLPRILVTFVPVVVYIFMSNKEKLTGEQEFYINSMFFNAFCMMAGMASKYFARIGIYTAAPVIIAYGHLFQTIDDEQTRKMIAFLTLSLYFLYWVYSLSAAGISKFTFCF